MRTPKRKPNQSPPEQHPGAGGQAASGLHINLAPAAQARLSKAGQARPEAAAEAGLPGWQSLGKGHKPTHAVTSRQGPRERKVRW
ncbi:hypothetical protein GD627_11090 [Arthrobacter yangruifuii]|uniref:Uncharacterized protein n=1 Tax=Arthrobacter yangruifuii TaxID=2606616 RepID=A0A5N6MEH9_9MICC|nr:hypothetical protein [Arthrobacter yangruifuii]KAD3514866.1 hypothetical protein GD627_11090 [Arthrobacter yangruifuii]